MSLAFLSDLSGAGVTVRVAAGQLKVSGDQSAIRRWLPEIRQHKAELLVALAAEAKTYRLFLVTMPDGSAFTASRCPYCTLAEMRADHPGATVEIAA